MEISATIPETVEYKGEVFEVTEFSAVLDITITDPGRPAQLYGEPGDCYPAEAALWKLDTAWLDVGSWDRELKRHIPKIIPCTPDYLGFIERWADSRAGRDDIATAIAEGDDGARDAYADSQWRERRLGEMT